ncbi:hypothetical protein JMM81_09130 [Bacillus sp. V3B]|uniref:hypothetical protein n=1 Tax=Bacillus sp. V3B TaxID=2804915 RepID=UPI002108F44B|nr:hypothetical protein [Bacillus sp. V3B]MCQ6275123.1 hypothetical protein [Bacillus sp. V3B]
MKSVQDAIYNWLTIRVVCEERPGDLAAVETEEMFWTILEDEHGLSNVTIDKDEVMYYITYMKDGESSKARFPRELIDVMINQINEEPEKYKIYPE